MLTTSFGKLSSRFLGLMLPITFGMMTTLRAQTPAASAVSCRIAGADTVRAGSTVSYTGHPCALANWTASCGTIIAKSDSGITVRFTAASCRTAVIAAGGVSKTVTILAAPAMAAATIAPSVQTIPANTLPALLSAGLAKGGLCDGVYSYQWYASTDSIHFSTIPGATGKDCQPGLLRVTTWFRRTDSCTVSGTVASNIATIRVIPTAAAISPSPAPKDTNTSITAGMLLPQIQSMTTDSLSSLLVCVGFGGGNANYIFQWYSSPDSSNWTPVPGVTTPGYNPGLISATTWFRVTVSSNGRSAISAPAVIYLNSKP